MVETAVMDEMVDTVKWAVMETVEAAVMVVTVVAVVTAVMDEMVKSQDSSYMYRDS